MMIEFTTSAGQRLSFRLSPGPVTEDGDTTPIPSALAGLDMYDRHRLALLVQAALDDQALTPGGEDNEE